MATLGVCRRRLPPSRWRRCRPSFGRCCNRSSTMTSVVSQNSSLPPSTLHPHVHPTPPKAKSKRKHGEQSGHAKCERLLIPVEECDRVVELQLGGCRRCRGRALAPLRHQVWQRPEIKPVVTEYQRQRWERPCCRETTSVELPAGVPSGQSGPRLTAFAGLLMACFRQNQRRTRCSSKPFWGSRA